MILLILPMTKQRSTGSCRDSVERTRAKMQRPSKSFKSLVFVWRCVFMVEVGHFLLVHFHTALEFNFLFPSCILSAIELLFLFHNSLRERLDFLLQSSYLATKLQFAAYIQLPYQIRVLSLRRNTLTARISAFSTCSRYKSLLRVSTSEHLLSNSVSASRNCRRLF